ncbi:hypothetical protein GUITHDRAFT_151752 [Guillardia theta CCMP2712]|uniref:Uncharacterized protein n=1 Tax=Guillardia theta (strain CCMP2712) TaxID=905079 RepID=L1JIV7_GUITC|nr:hypothetical protein GUITHDRAFT_151752 [Guillardia theta CCMP2712]EKX48453.1 hypothetical protein GUITHDRAFT_151752 [Guillardia theta CCMP2712]|eukprot:XP_005835433.1 hypothetical protein GUITHDRAFT_151752 [Guillardia theta CCMP2712]
MIHTISEVHLKRRATVHVLLEVNTFRHEKHCSAPQRQVSLHPFGNNHSHGADNSHLQPSITEFGFLREGGGYDPVLFPVSPTEKSIDDYGNFL